MTSTASRSCSPSTTTRASRAPSLGISAATTARRTGWCAPSPGPEALETLRELKLRGDLVAVLLADHRMPEMSGLEFLEEAMDLFPHARRALLTAYADTDAAIEAINVVDLDHYLLKPWDPPEEKLYPVVDSLIEMWLASDEQPVSRTQVVGHRWSAHSFEVRDFLARNSVPYRWLIERGARGAAAAGGGRGGCHGGPAGGDARRRPSRRSRASATWRPGWGCRRRPPPTSTTS